MQMALYNIKACHFVVWNPHFCTGTLVPYQEGFASSNAHMIAFHEKVISYELVSRKLETTNQCKDEKKLQEKELFCYCQQPESELDMIGCDNPQCKYKWVHFKCIKPALKRAPKGAWYCKYCKKKK